MTDKNCSSCVYYEPKKEPLTLGMCEYPVPEYLTTGNSGGSFIGHPDYQGANCSVYKSKLDLASEAIDNQKG